MSQASFLSSLHSRPLCCCLLLVCPVCGFAYCPLHCPPLKLVLTLSRRIEFCCLSAIHSLIIFLPHFILLISSFISNRVDCSARLPPAFSSSFPFLQPDLALSRPISLLQLLLLLHPLHIRALYSFLTVTRHPHTHTCSDSTYSY